MGEANTSSIDDDLLLKNFYAEVSEAERDNEVARILSCFKLNAFEYLNLPFDSPIEDVKKQYRKLSLLVHPDKCKHPKAKEAFGALAKAQQLLLDPQEREYLLNQINAAREELRAKRKKQLKKDTASKLKSQVDEGKYEQEYEKSEAYQQQLKSKVREILTDQEWRRRKMQMRISEEEGRLKKDEEESKEMWKRKREHEGDAYCGANPEGGDALITLKDGSSMIGGKRHGEEFGGSFPKHQRTTPSITSLGFQSPGVKSGIASYAFRSLGTCPSFFTSSTTGPVTATVSSSDFAGTSTVGGDVLPSSTSIFAGLCTSQFPPGFLAGENSSIKFEPLSDAHWGQIDEAANHLYGGGFSQSYSFMAERTSSTLVPPPVSDFNKGLGSHFYVPPSVIRVRDDGQNPAQARNLLDSIVPPLLTADVVRRGNLFDLAAHHDLYAFNSVVTGCLLRQSFFGELKKMSETIFQLREDISSRDSSLRCLSDDLQREKSVSSSLKKDKEELEAMCSSMRADLGTLTEEKKRLNDRNFELDKDLHFKNVALDQKQNQLDEMKLSFQKEINALKAELVSEGQLKMGSLAQVERLESEMVVREARSKALLEAFPQLFERLLNHPDVKGAFDAFNTAALRFGQHDASRKLSMKHPVLKLPILFPSAFGDLRAASDVWKAKAFPVLDRIVSTLGITDVPIIELLDRIAPLSSIPALATS